MCHSTGPVDNINCGRYHYRNANETKTASKCSHIFQMRFIYLLKSYNLWDTISDRLCGLVVRVLGYRSGGPGSIPGTAREKY
jgi:hypothetical protein